VYRKVFNILVWASVLAVSIRLVGLAQDPLYAHSKEERQPASSLSLQRERLPVEDPYEIQLHSRQFTPEVGVESTLTWGGVDAADIELERIHVLLQLYHVPQAEERTALQSAGIELLNYIPHNAWFASVPANNPGATLTSPQLMGIVRWAGTIRPEDKVPPDVWTGQIGGWAVANDGRLRLAASFFDDVPIDVARQVISRHGGVVEGEVSMSNKLLILLRPAEIRALAAEDSVRWLDQVPPPPVTHNDGSRNAVYADIVQAAPYNLSGRGIIVGIWDGGAVDWNHDDFHGSDGTTRVVSRTVTIADHATHVAGTMAGSGARSQAAGGTDRQWRGVAPDAGMISYDFGDPIHDYPEAIGMYDIDLSQNSWGWDFDVVPCDFYGDYRGEAPDFDRVVTGQNGKVIAVIFSAGNERGYAHCSAHKPYGNITPPATAKNIVTVGASNSNDNSMTSFSSWGPVDDGRLKPEVVAPGCQVGGGINSTIPALFIDLEPRGNPDGVDDYSDPYDIMCGTSMAAPVVSGIGALLIEQYREIYNNTEPWPSTIKALLVQSAHDLDDETTSWYNPGPDYASGYGLVDAQAAVDLVRAGAIREDTISANGEVDMFDVWVPPGASEIKVTLAWDDPPAVENAAQTLVNDLDLLLWSPIATHMPWVLDPAHPEADAIPVGRDDTNNLEQVLVTNPMTGKWTIVISGTRVSRSPQDYSIVSEALFDILRPQQGSQVYAGSASAPHKMIVETTKPQAGLAASQFQVTVGALSANVLTAYEASDSYVVEIMPAQPPANGSYALSVMVPGASVWNVKENGVLFADANNIDVDLVIDRSGSMGSDDKMGAAKEAAKQFVDLMHTDDMIGVVGFDDAVETNFSLTAITSPDVQIQAKDAIDALYDRGTTSIGGGLQRGQEQLTSLGNASHPWAIVLLSDGLENESPYVADVLPDIVASKTVVHTIGLGSDADEPLMQDIASQTGGTCHFTPGPQELAGIYNTIAGALSGQQVLFSETGTVQQGATDEKDVVVDSTVSEATFSISWSDRNSTLDLTLRRPNGSIVDPSVAAPDPNIDFVSGSTYQYYRVKDPATGVWTMRVAGGYIPLSSAQGSETYTAIVAGRAGLTLYIYLDEEGTPPYQSVKIAATLSDDQAITGATVACKVQSPSSLSTRLRALPWIEVNGDLVPDPEAVAQAKAETASPSSVLTLYDDGNHGDGQANDGVYANAFTNIYQEGTYRFLILASGTSNHGESFIREVEDSIYLQGGSGRSRQIYLPLSTKAYGAPPAPTWHPGANIEGRTVYGLAVAPANCSTLYAATDGGIFKSTNGGASWFSTGLNTLLAAQDLDSTAPLFAKAKSGIASATLVSAVTTDPANGQVVYATSWGSGVLKSTDGGASWAAVNNGLGDLWLYAITADPANGQVLYAGGNSGGVFKSTDGGGAWAAVNSGLGNLNIRSLAVDPANSQVLYAGTQGGVYKSVDGAAWWAPTGGLGAGDPWAIVIDPANTQTLYTALGGGGVYKSVNGGGGWFAVNNGLVSGDLRALIADPADSQLLYAGTNGVGVYRTSDGGASWSTMNNGLGSRTIKALQKGRFCDTIHAGTTNGAWLYSR